MQHEQALGTSCAMARRWSIVSDMVLVLLSVHERSGSWTRTVKGVKRCPSVHTCELHCVNGRAKLSWRPGKALPGAKRRSQYAAARINHKMLPASRTICAPDVDPCRSA